MLRYVLSALLILGCYLPASAQMITVGQLPDPICINAEVLLPITTTGTFAATNRFVVQLTMNTYSSSSILSFPAELIDGRLRVTIKDLPYADHQLSSSFYLRVVSTNPVVQSDWSSFFYLRFPATITLSSALGAINAYDPYTLQLAGRGSSPLTVTLNDSLDLATGGNYSSVSFSRNHTINPWRNGTFRITNVQNMCGKGEGSGTADVKINPIALRITSLSGSSVCIGGTLRINYTKEQGEFGAGNKFKVRFSKISEPKFVVELDAIDENGSLTVQLSDNLNPRPDNFTAVPYQVSILSSQPAIVSPPAETIVEISSRPAAKFTSASQSIALGQSTDLRIKAVGAPPYAVTLSDNSVVQNVYDELIRTVNPARTTSYSLVAFSSGCGTAEPDRSILYVSVRAGLLIDSLPNRPLCEGQTIQTRFITNATFSPGARYFVSLVDQYEDKVIAEAPATRSGNKLTFTVPVLPTGFVMLNNTSFRVRVKVDELTSIFNGPFSSGTIFINRRPKAVLRFTSQPVTVKEAGASAYIYADYTGGGPYTVTMSDGSVHYNNSRGDNINSGFNLYPLQSGTYTVKEVRNLCFVGTSEGAVQVTVANADKTGLLLQPLPTNESFQQYRTYRCPQDSLPITFTAFGRFEADNRYSIQVSRDYGIWQTIATNVRPGLSRIKLGAGNYQVRVSSSNPLLYSQEQYIVISEPPTAKLTNFGGGADWDTPVAGEFRTLNINLEGGTAPYQLVLTDGTNDIVRTVTSSFQEQVQLNRSVAYALKSVTDICGAGAVGRDSVKYVVEPLRVVINTSTNRAFFVCAGNSLTLPFTTVGVTSATTTYQLQLAQTNGQFNDLGSAVTQSPFIVTIPADLPAGVYQLRIVIRNPDVISASQPIGIRTKPTALLTTDNGSDVVEIDYSSTQLRLNLSGGASNDFGYRVVFDDNIVGYYLRNNSREVFPTRRTTYALKSVMNSCGYGTVSGRVTVSVKPTMTLRVTSTNTNRVCVGQPVSVSFASRGEFGPTNVFRLTLRLYNSQTTVLLDSTRSETGSFNLTIPITLVPGAYQLRLTATDPALTTTTDLYVSAPPQVSLSGNTLINAGQTAYLRLTSPAGSGNSQEESELTLSNGQRVIRAAYTNYNEPTYVAVAPTQTTSYSIASVRNSCGAGQGFGSATVTVNPASATRIAVTQIGIYSGTSRICAGDTVRLTYSITGTVLPGTNLIAQLSDSTGSDFVDLPTLSPVNNVVQALLPAALPRGNGYRIRIKASDPAVSSGAYAYPLTIGYRATARFASATTSYESGKHPQTVVQLTGDGPWEYRISTDLTSFTRSAQRSPDTLSFQAVSPIVFLKLTSVYGSGCGFGKIEEPSLLGVELVTALEPGVTHVRVFPNPTTDRVKVVWNALTGEAYTLQVINSGGTTLFTQTSRRAEEEVSLSGLPAGTYLLKIKSGNRYKVYRIIKQ